MFINHVAFAQVPTAQTRVHGCFSLVRSLSINSAINQSLRRSRSQRLRSTRSKSPANLLERSPTAIDEAARPSKDRVSFISSPLSARKPCREKERYGPLFKKRHLDERKFENSEESGQHRAALKNSSASPNFRSKPTKNLINPRRLSSSVRHQAGIPGYHRHDPASEIRSFRRSDKTISIPFDQRLGKSYQVGVEKKYFRHEAPVAVPYTTSASEFLYGTSVIKAALNARRRKLYTFYIYDGENREVRDQDASIRKLALEKNVVVRNVKGTWLQLMDKMSQGRPHNGYVLEASPLPKRPVSSLQRVEKSKNGFDIVLDHQSTEEEDINGRNTKVECGAHSLRFPFVVMLDGVLDSGNLGAIVRSAFYLGVDAIVISNHCAPFSAVTLKASAGSAEFLPLMTASQPIGFLDACKANGWKVYAANAPKMSSPLAPKAFSTSNVGRPLRNDPCILVLGSEGEGLRWRIQKKADFQISIEGQRHGEGEVDSLNVSVAAGLLFQAFLRQPDTHMRIDSFEENKFKEDSLF